MIKKKSLILTFIIIIFSAIAFAEANKTDSKPAIDPVAAKINIGMTQTQVRRVAGMPRLTTMKKWRYSTFFIMFEQGKVSCIIDNKCFGKWQNCKSYRLHSQPCIIK